MPNTWPAGQLPRSLGEGQACLDTLAIESILGVPFTPEGVSRTFQGCLSGCHAVTRLKANRDTGQVVMTVSLLSPTGEPAARFMTSLIRHHDGSLELHRGLIRVEPEFRGQHITDRVTHCDIVLLRGLSSHSASKMSLRAASFDSAAAETQFGSYVWARNGLFQCSSQEMDRLRGGFCNWLECRTELTSEERFQARHLAQQWATPYQVARSTLPGRTFAVQLEALHSQCELGKAYLLSEKCPDWFGTCMVNQPASREACQGLARVLECGQPLSQPPPPVGPVVDRLWERFQQPNRPVQQRSRDCADASGLGRRVPGAIRLAALNDDSDEVRQAVATAQFQLLPQDVMGALETAWSLLERAPGSSQLPLYWQRMARADGLRVLLDYAPDWATAQRLEGLWVGDRWVGQVVEDALASLRSGKPQGFFSDTCGDYLEDILQA